MGRCNLRAHGRPLARDLGFGLFIFGMFPHIDKFLSQPFLP